MERESFMALHPGITKGCAAALTNNQTIGCHSRQKFLQQHHYYVLKQSLNGASTIFALAS